MKSFRVLVATALILAASSSVWHVAAHSQLPAGKAARMPDPLAEWQYPGAARREESNGERLGAIPLHGLLSKTTDPIATVYRFYQKKCDPHFVANQGNAWQPESQATMLTTQFADGGESGTYLHSPRKDADTMLMIIHQPRRTLTVQISCDPQDKSTTDVLLVADEH